MIRWPGSMRRVCRCFAARGICPAAHRAGLAGPTTLAVGGHLKNTVALGLGSRPMQVVLSPHVGDLDSMSSVEVFRRAIDDLVDFFAVVPELVACDLHPDYASTRHAEQLAARWQRAAAASAAPSCARGRLHGRARPGGPGAGVRLGRHRLRRRRHDLGRRGAAVRGAGFVRVAHLRTFALPGGDRAMRQPRRSALGLLYEIMGGQAAADVLAGQAAAPPIGSRPPN